MPLQSVEQNTENQYFILDSQPVTDVSLNSSEACENFTTVINCKCLCAVLSQVYRKINGSHGPDGGDEVRHVTTNR